MVRHKKMTSNQASLPQNFFTESFSTLTDSCRTSKGNILYSLEELLFVTVSAAICGYVIWTDIAEYERLKQDWFRKFYPYKKMPSHDALSELFSALELKKFAECFLNWVNGIGTKTTREVVAVDGKTIRGYASQGNKFPCISSPPFAPKTGLRWAGKGNELTTIPQLLDLLTLENCIVTLDAIKYQKNIAEKIIDRKANHILKVKNNQQDLREQLEDIFNSRLPGKQMGQLIRTWQDRKRTCETILDLNGLYDAQSWESLDTIVLIKSERTIKKTLEKSTKSSIT